MRWLLVLCLGCAPSDPELGFDTVRHVAMPPAGTRLPAPRGIAPGAGDEVLVLDNAGRILVFDREGKVLRSWWMPDVDVGRPEGICRLADGRVVVADTHYHRLVFFDESERLGSTLGSEGTGPGQFIYPVRVIQDPEGFLYVAEYGSNDRVQKFTAEGQFVLQFGAFGTGPGEFQRPSGLVWRDNTVYVADAVNHRIEVFTDQGQYLGRLGGDSAPELRFPYDLTEGPNDTLYAVEYGAGRVTALTLEGELVGRFGSAGKGSGQMATPWALTALPSEAGLELWITDTGNRRLLILR